MRLERYTSETHPHTRTRLDNTAIESRFTSIVALVVATLLVQVLFATLCAGAFYVAPKGSYEIVAVLAFFWFIEVCGNVVHVAGAFCVFSLL